MNAEEQIIVIYTSVDRCRIRKTFKTLDGARKFAHKMIGEHPDIGLRQYAISGDGIGKVTVHGAASLNDLFPQKTWSEDSTISDEERIAYIDKFE